LLAQARLAQSQTSSDRRAAAVRSQGDKYFRVRATVTGAAYENALRPRDAATAYEAAATAALYPFLRAQFLSDAGRAWLAAGDTAKASRPTDDREKLDSTSTAGEAKVRLGE